MMKTLLVALAVLTLGCAAVFAQGSPTNPEYYRVAGVAADDVLNIRAHADATSQIVGSLQPDTAPVEILLVENGWGYVIAGEGMGWASMSYLEEIDVPMLGESALPQDLVCAGTEPFWSLAFSGEAAFFNAIDAEELEVGMNQADTFGGAGPHRNFLLGEGPGLELTAIVSNEMCSDGMSDRDYPRRIDMVVTSLGSARGYTGCCNMPISW